jgi:hypothetical protein
MQMLSVIRSFDVPYSISKKFFDSTLWIYDWLMEYTELIPAKFLR